MPVRAADRNFKPQTYAATHHMRSTELSFRRSTNPQIFELEWESMSFLMPRHLRESIPLTQTNGVGEKKRPTNVPDPSEDMWPVQARS